MTGISFITRFANGTILVNIEHPKRFFASACLATCAFFLIAFASFHGEDKDSGKDESGYFWVAIAATMLVGCGMAMGEATFLGYCRGFPSHVVGYVSSGTGCAGLTGTGTMLVLQSIELKNSTIFLIASPSMLIYLSAIYWLHK
jgi:hypothetical protein